MFQNSKAFSSFSVDDAGKARAFYSQVLGLEVFEIPGMGGMFELKVHGSTPIMVYPKADHKPANFTVLNFPVEDAEDAVDRLIGLGILPERYEQDDIKTDTKGIHREKEFTISWFKDPAGNVFSVMSGKLTQLEEEMAEVVVGSAGGP